MFTNRPLAITKRLWHSFSTGGLLLGVIAAVALSWLAPDWMLPPRGPDVSPELRWFPVVTLLQLMLDMLRATDAPIGFGHVYAAAHYIDSWSEVTDVRDWSPAAITRLKQHLSKP